MTEKGEEKAGDRAPSKAERQACWDSRDAYWQCLDKYGDGDARCEKMKFAYEQSCPAQWVKHFDRKYVFNQYKKKMESEGFEPITASQTTRSQAARSSSPAPSSSPSSKAVS
ncbi:hypothetical protein RvY_03379 [Ramazzottius varieornatus]|uniref:Cytochrome c oxidase assembly factor 6 n=1 Tax=Ramazzottius varieornatus TaxID=947166 RepID=A0A1D1UR84_RAMVA|nr:hypothetical protein RvY_03379 [Ramazzottius varieornatus]